MPLTSYSFDDMIFIGSHAFPHYVTIRSFTEKRKIWIRKKNNLSLTSWSFFTGFGNCSSTSWWSCSWNGQHPYHRYSNFESLSWLLKNMSQKTFGLRKESSFPAHFPREKCRAWFENLAYFSCYYSSRYFRSITRKISINYL